VASRSFRHRVRDAVVRANHRLGGAGLRRLLQQRREGALFRVLCLHRIDNAETFRHEIRLLKKHFQIMPLHELLTRDTSASGVRLAITFDDGYPEQFEVAAPVLREEGVPATFFVISGSIDLPDAEAVAFYRDRVGVANGRAPTSQMVSAIASDPLFKVGSHSETHPDMGQALAHDELLEELQSSKTTLEAITGTPVESIAYPYGGQVNVAAGLSAAVREAGFAYALTIRPGFNSAATDRLMLHRDSLGPETDDRLLLAWLAGGYDDLKRVADAVGARRRRRKPQERGR
jgi:peptidoglycan/xylan/chitin deacetylase (PgdA/CDA1 family)